MAEQDGFQLDWGYEFLERGRHFENQCEEETVAGLISGHLGERAQRLYRGLGEGLSLLTVLASCQLGCRGTDHVLENLTRRFVNFTLAALRLACRGYYDESIGLTRNAAEILNLLQLFRYEQSQISDWSTLDERARRERFGPANVRRSLEALGITPLIEREAYAALCEAGVHLSPESARQTHDLERERVYVGPYLSVAGVILVLSELGYILARTLPLVDYLLAAPRQHSEASEHIKTGLLAQVGRGEMRMTNYKAAMEWFKQKADGVP